MYDPCHQRDFTTTVPLLESTALDFGSIVVVAISYVLKSHAGKQPLVYLSAVNGLSLGSHGSFLTSLSINSSGGSSSSPGPGLGSACFVLPYFKIDGV